MKILFFLTLLINIALFFWGFNSPTSKDLTANNQKQIFLLSELPKEINTPPTLALAKKSDSTPSKTKATVQKTEPKKRPPKTSTDKVLDTKDTLLVNKKTPVEKKPLIAPVKDTNSSPPLVVKSASKKENTKIALDNILCYQVGPFKSAGEFRQWARVNRIEDHTFSYINKGNKKGTKYLVYSPPADSKEQTKKDISNIKQIGIKDFFLFRKGDLKGAISLGLFAREERALIQQREFQEKGLVLKIIPLYPKGAVIFAQFLTKNKNFKQGLAVSGQQKVLECK